MKQYFRAAKLNELESWKERGWVGSGIQSINEVNFPPDAPDNEDEDNVDNNREDKDNNYLPRCFSFKAKSVCKWIMCHILKNVIFSSQLSSSEDLEEEQRMCHILNEANFSRPTVLDLNKVSFSSQILVDALNVFLDMVKFLLPWGFLDLIASRSCSSVAL